jgi:hypothetical protein
MLTHLKHRLFQWLFREDIYALKREKLLVEQQKMVKPDIVALTRHNLSVFTPLDVGEDKELRAYFPDNESWRVFLGKCKTIADSDALQVILRYLVAGQVEFTAKEATSMESVNFSRGCVNGYTLLREELDKLSGEYAALTAQQEAFDVHEVI